MCEVGRDRNRTEGTHGNSECGLRDPRESEFLRVTHGSLVCGLGGSHEGLGYECGVWDPMGIWSMSHDWRLSGQRQRPGVLYPRKLALDVGHPKGAAQPCISHLWLCCVTSCYTVPALISWPGVWVWLGWIPCVGWHLDAGRGSCLSELRVFP